jgi:hypothetical protein
MHVIETEEDLFRDLFDKMHGDALILMSFDETEQVFAENLENHANMDAIRAFVTEMIKK